MMPEPRDRTLRRGPIVAVGAFTAAYIIAAGAIALARGNREFIFYIVVMLVMIGGIALVHWRLNLSAALLWALAAWGLLHMAGGLVPLPAGWPYNGEHAVLYSWWIIPRDGAAPDQLQGWLKYDNLVHAYGYGIAAWLLWQVLRAIVRRRTTITLRPTIGVMVLIVAASSGFGALNEVIEFIATLIAETNVGGYVNTGIDLVTNLLGAMIAAAAMMLLDRRPRKDRG